MSRPVWKVTIVHDNSSGAPVVYYYYVVHLDRSNKLIHSLHRHSIPVKVTTEPFGT